MEQIMQQRRDRNVLSVRAKNGRICRNDLEHQRTRCQCENGLIEGNRVLPIWLHLIDTVEQIAPLARSALRLRHGGLMFQAALARTGATGLRGL